MKIKSYAKVNLFFLILGFNEKKNLHKISSLYQKIYTLYDEIEIYKNNSNVDEIVYFDKNKKILKIKNCIIKKTLSYLREKKVINDYYKITIIKNIPLGGGLGGGSSNAAEVIKFALKSEGKKITRKISKLILNIGSDVNFFVHNHEFALVSGYGEKIKKINIENNHKIKIYLQDINCQTQKVFEKYKESENKQYKNKNNVKEQINYIKNKKYNLLVNDLQDSCFSVYPKLYSSYKKNMKDNKVIKLSGSGSTLFQIK